jgi:hypothetical protein
VAHGSQTRIWKSNCTHTYDMCKLMHHPCMPKDDGLHSAARHAKTRCVPHRPASSRASLPQLAGLPFSPLGHGRGLCPTTPPRLDHVTRGYTKLTISSRKSAGSGLCVEGERARGTGEIEKIARYGPSSASVVARRWCTQRHVPCTSQWGWIVHSPGCSLGVA